MSFKARSVVFLALWILSLGQALGAGVSFTLSETQGFNPKRYNQLPVGFMSSLTIAGTSLVPDLAVKRPDSPTTTSSVVAVLRSVSWNGSSTGPIAFEMQISTANKAKIAALLAAKPTSNAVSLKFQVFDFDPLAKTFVEAFAPDRSVTVSAHIQTDGSTALLALGSVSDAVKSPENWTLSLGVAAPTTRAYDLRYSTAKGNSVLKKWGVPPNSM